MRNFKDIRSNQPISYYCPNFRDVAPFPPIDPVVLPQNFPPTLETGPSSKIDPGPFFSPAFSFPPEIGPFVEVPGPFFRTRPFPCCRPDLVVQDNKSQQQLIPTGFEDKAKPYAEQSLNIEICQPDLPKIDWTTKN